jgi:acetyl esterase/lipase
LASAARGEAIADAPGAEPEYFLLWPGVPPGGQGVDLPQDPREIDTTPGARIIAAIGRPTLLFFRAQNPDGSAVLIAPGGGYLFEALDQEGIAVARALNRRGISAFVLVYRLPSEGWRNGAEVPLQDAQRAMRLLRARAFEYGIDPARTGVLGFSAGGHLAGQLATRFSPSVYAPVDAADNYDARPSFAGLVYPVVTMMPPFAHEASCAKLLGADASPTLRAAYSIERAVMADTSPCFLCAAADDPDVPVDNTLAMFASLRAQNVAAEMHIFEKGGHGFGLGLPGQPLTAWPDLFLAWLGAHGFLRKAQS